MFGLGPLINRYRGSYGRGVPSVLTGLFTALPVPVTSPSMYLAHAAVFAAAWFLWATPGWGLYWATFTNKWVRDEREVHWIDAIGLKLWPWREEIDLRNGTRGTFCMFLRMLYALPFFGAVGAAWGLTLFGLCTGITFALVVALSYKYCAKLALVFGTKDVPLNRTGYGATEVAEYLVGWAFDIFIAIISMAGLASLASLV